MEQLERAVLLHPEDPTINDHLGDAYWMMNRHLEARFQWRHALAMKPDSALAATVEEKLKSGLKSGDKQGS
jgi:Flp pilus assembly protein TadD